MHGKACGPILIEYALYSERLRRGGTEYELVWLARNSSIRVWRVEFTNEFESLEIRFRPSCLIYQEFFQKTCIIGVLGMIVNGYILPVFALQFAERSRCSSFEFFFPSIPIERFDNLFCRNIFQLAASSSCVGHGIVVQSLEPEYGSGLPNLENPIFALRCNSIVKCGPTGRGSPFFARAIK